jgi:hypothetical protein
VDNRYGRVFWSPSVTIQPKAMASGWAKRTMAKFLIACRTAILEITGYATAIFLAEILVKIWSHQ